MRPNIICHMVSSIDGRLLVDRWSEPAAGIDGAMLRGHYDAVAARLDNQGWIVGRKTMEDYAKGTTRSATATTFPRENHIAERGERDIAVAIDLHGRLHYGTAPSSRPA